MICLSAKPNAAHTKLAEMEQKGILSAVVTQNIDGLHQMAGSKTVYELHGSVHRNYCERCHACYDAEWILQTEGVPHCPHCGGLVKPDVVLYEESLPEQTVEQAVRAIAAADVLLIGGNIPDRVSSVQPAPVFSWGASGGVKSGRYTNRRASRPLYTG